MLVVVGAAAVLCALFSPPLVPKVGSDAVPALLFFENLFYIVREVPYFAAAGLPSPLTHLWFVGVTMQFYLVWPLVLLLLSRAVRHRRTACAIVAVLALASFVEMAALYDPLADTARVYYGPDTRAGELLVGALAALLTRGRGWSLRILSRTGGSRELPGWAYDLAGVGCVAAVAAMMALLNGYSDVVYRGGIALVSRPLRGPRRDPQPTRGPARPPGRAPSALRRRGARLCALPLALPAPPRHEPRHAHDRAPMVGVGARARRHRPRRGGVVSCARAGRGGARRPRAVAHCPRRRDGRPCRGPGRHALPRPGGPACGPVGPAAGRAVPGGRVRPRVRGLRRRGDLSRGHRLCVGP